MNQAVLLFLDLQFQSFKLRLGSRSISGHSDGWEKRLRDGLLHCSDDDLQRALLFFRRRILHFNVTKHPTS
jgi:hypothetical protein